MNTLTKILIGAGVVVGGYQLYKHATKPKDPPKSGQLKSSASGKKQAGALRYERSTKKIQKLVVDGFDSRWVYLHKEQQPKPMDWYNLNGKWVWVAWNGTIKASLPYGSYA